VRVKALWLFHIPIIVPQLETFDVSVVEGVIIERLFGLRRRQAIELLKFRRLPGRPDLPGAPAPADRAPAASGRWCGIPQEHRRQERLDQAVDEIRRQQAAARVKRPTAAGNWPTCRPGWPGRRATCISHFPVRKICCARYFELFQAANSDFDRFRAVAKPADQRIA
jgi:hypothetical protein